MENNAPIEVLIPPSVEGGQVYRVVAREGHTAAERWDVSTWSWVRTTRTSVMIASMPPAGPGLLARLGIAAPQN